MTPSYASVGPTQELSHPGSPNTNAPLEDCPTDWSTDFPEKPNGNTHAEEEAKKACTSGGATNWPMAKADSISQRSISFRIATKNGPLQALRGAMALPLSHLSIISELAVAMDLV
jgi:hypothetical protein